MESKPKKVVDLLGTVRECVLLGKYFDTTHAKIRQKERKIVLTEIIHVLLNGVHEKSKDRIDEVFNEWNYAIRGKTIDGRPLRIIVSFDQETNLLIITAIHLES